MSSLIIKGLNKIYTVDNKALQVLHNLNLQADCRKITVILGQSGCGKTTLLRLISGLETPTSGSIEFSEPTKLGMVFQEARLMPWLTTAENIIFGCREKPSPKVLNDLIATVGLSGFEKAYPRALSGGMQQRVALARALILNSKLLLMDEPFAALDYFTRLNMQQELLRIQRSAAMGIVLVTHNIDEALILADKICILQAGSIVKTIDLPANKQRDILTPEFIQHKRTILTALQIN